MKKILSPSLLILLFSCGPQNSETGKYIDPIILKFFKTEIFEGELIGKNALYFIYPSFCGACNDTVINFIAGNSLLNFNNKYIFSEVDTFLISRFNDLKGEIYIFEPDHLMKHGLYNATNHIYLMKDSTLLYDNSITSENINEIRQSTSVY